MAVDDQVLYERKVLKAVTGLVFVGLLIWLVALSTDYWVIVVAMVNGGVVLPDTNGITFLWSHSGLWRRCDLYRSGDSPDVISRCEVHPFHDSTHAFRAQVAFCVILLLLSVMATGFSIYSLLHPRYTYKRVSSALHFITAASVIALNEMVKSNMSSPVFPGVTEPIKDAKVYFGFSYLLSWCLFIIFFLAGIAFAVGSKKRKMMHYDVQQILS